jgi:hypothetical protein
MFHSTEICPLGFLPASPSDSVRPVLFIMGRKKTDWESRAKQAKEAESSAWASFSKHAEPMSSFSLLDALSEIKTSKRTKVGVAKKPKVNKKLLRLKRRKEDLVRKAGDRKDKLEERLASKEKRLDIKLKGKSLY